MGPVEQAAALIVLLTICISILMLISCCIRYFIYCLTGSVLLTLGLAFIGLVVVFWPIIIPIILVILICECRRASKCQNKCDSK